GSLAADWQYLCKQMAHDLKIGAPAALARLAAVRAQVVSGERARLVEGGSSANRAAVAGDVEQLGDAPPARKAKSPPPGAPGGPGPLERRLAERGAGGKPPLFLGLVDPSTSSGVFVHIAPSTSYNDDSEDALLDYLAANLYTGHGAHSMFMK